MSAPAPRRSPFRSRTRSTTLRSAPAAARSQARQLARPLARPLVGAGLLALLPGLVGLALTAPAAQAAPVEPAWSVATAGRAGHALSDPACEPHRDGHGDGHGDAAGGARAIGGSGADTYASTAAELRAVERRLARLPRAARLGSQTTVQVPVHAHVIRTKKVKGPSRKKVDRQLRVLEDAFAGGQSEDSAVAGFTFRLESYERVRNKNWYRARLDGNADRTMRRTLHRGGPEALNLYILAPRGPVGGGGGVILGWSSLPWHVADAPRLDGITLHRKAMQNGKFAGFDEGDTMVHETGHWLGLLHTFEGGCADLDQVEDTPAQGRPSSWCNETQDTCPDLPGLDPVRNFMDYSPDPCMNMFTAGQVTRMTDLWTAYRAPAT